MGTGIRYSSGEPLFQSIDGDEFARRIEHSLTRNAGIVRTEGEETAVSLAYRGERLGRPTVNLADPREAGWTFLVHRDDPRREEITAAIRPLAEHRGMRNPQKPLLFSGEHDWTRWMIENYAGIPARPHYVLLAGNPERIPFHFQALFDVAASVGRVDFDLTKDLHTYVEKLIRLEVAPSPSAMAEVIIFAPDYGRREDGSYDATYFSRRYMAEPLTQFVRSDPDFRVVSLLGEEATKQGLLDTLGHSQPAVVFTASHGIGAIDEDIGFQRQINGAICCQRTGREHKQEDYIFRAEDVILSQPFLEGSVVFQFACYGYGTPAVSDFAHWALNVPPKNAPVDFVAALPKQLLAHPRGPVAFIGHVDTAWLHGFDDPDDPFVQSSWNPRLEPFKNLIEVLLKAQPPGLAMGDFNTRYSVLNAKLAGILDRKQRGDYQDNSEARNGLARDFITRSDAQNYMILGDPAARLRIWTE